jgi:hypothetical protein
MGFIKQIANNIPGPMFLLHLYAGISDVTAAFQAALKDGERDDAKHELVSVKSIEEKARTLTSDLESDGSVAIEKLQSGLKQLVYVVLYTSLKN